MMRVDDLPPTFTTDQARALGVHPRELYAWRDDEAVLELSRGVFRRADAPPVSLPDVLAVSLRAPRAIVCCVSAAAIHAITDELPSAVQIAVPRRGHSPAIDFPPTTVLRFADAGFELGLSSVEAAPGESVRVYDAARTVVDLIRLRHRFGESVAYAALQRYLSGPQSRPAQLLKYADALGAFGPVRAALDVAVSR